MYDVNTHDVRRYFGHVWQNRLNPLQLDALQQKALRMRSRRILNTKPILSTLKTIWIKIGRLSKVRTNPFLHLSLHLSIQEQVGIDQPFGIRSIHQKIGGHAQ